MNSEANRPGGHVKLATELCGRKRKYRRRDKSVEATGREATGDPGAHLR